MIKIRMLILGYLAQFGPSFGLDIVRYGISSRGAIYVHLSALEDDGLVDSWLAEPETGRRKYRITAIGRRVLP